MRERFIAYTPHGVSTRWEKWRLSFLCGNKVFLDWKSFSYTTKWDDWLVMQERWCRRDIGCSYTNSLMALSLGCNLHLFVVFSVKMIVYETWLRSCVFFVVFDGWRWQKERKMHLCTIEWWKSLINFDFNPLSLHRFSESTCKSLQRHQRFWI